jgi:hypothetical protein
VEAVDWTLLGVLAGVLVERALPGRVSSDHAGQAVVVAAGILLLVAALTIVDGISGPEAIGLVLGFLGGVVLQTTLRRLARRGARRHAGADGRRRTVGR